MKKLTEHDPLAVALLAAVVIWLIFDSVIFGLLAGAAGFIAVGQAQKDKKKQG